jgi:hypothetical protein
MAAIIQYFLAGCKGLIYACYQIVGDLIVFYRFLYFFIVFDIILSQTRVKALSIFIPGIYNFSHQDTFSPHTPVRKAHAIPAINGCYGFY